MPARRPSGRESKWAGMRRRIPQRPVKNNPPSLNLGGRTTRFYRFTAMSGFFLLLFFISACLLLQSHRAERCSAEWRLLFLFTSGKFVSAADGQRDPVSLSESQRKHLCFTAADTRSLFTQSVNKSCRSHCSVTFSPSTANSGSSPRTTLPTLPPLHHFFHRINTLHEGQCGEVLCVTSSTHHGHRCPGSCPFLNSSS